MKIVCAGGGSGGHVTPVLAVINELSRHNQPQVWFVTERSFAPQARNIMARSSASVDVKLIHAGKIRRYYGVSWWGQLLHLPTVFLNLRDVFLLAFGCLESLWLLGRVRPDVVFTKGGFVCVPVGLAARLLRIPLVIHDSDTHPGLTSRILSRYASAIATGAPLKYYPYPKHLSHYVGIPVDQAYKPASASEQAELKRMLGYAPDMPLVLVTGGGLGAKRINDAMILCAHELVRQAQVVHLTGTKHLEAVKQRITGLQRYEIMAFADEAMPSLVRAADVVVSRAGATTLLELAASAKPTIIIPHPYLAGGHQTKNAKVYSDAGAAVVLQESELTDHPARLLEIIEGLLKSAKQRHELGHAMGTFAKPHAATEVAKLILNVAKKSRGGGV